MSEAEYVCLTLLAEEQESREAFQARLTQLWTEVLRQQPQVYEQVYAEAVEFSQHQGRWARQYMVALDAVDALLEEVSRRKIAFAPVDREDLYSRYEASGPEWYQIEH
jgi:spore coat polysaccharide biosynthesis protein SpsF (cytidylyltransferase family)